MRARLLLRWSARDLRKRLPVVVAIAVVIAIGTGLYTAVGSLETWRKQSNDASYSMLRAHDLRVHLAEGSFAQRGRLARALRRAGGADVASTQERLVAETQVEATTGARAALTPGRLIGFDPAARGPQIDRLGVEQGRGLRGSDRGRKTAVLEAKYARYYGLPPRGTIRLAGGDRLRYVGHVLSPEYFLVTRATGGDFGAAEANYAVVFVPLDTAQALAGRPGSVNELVLRLRPGVSRDAAARRFTRALRRELPDLGVDVTPISEETSFRVLYRDAEGDQRIFNMFALLILGGAAFAAFNLSSRIVESQRREIGIGMALGVPAARLAIRPLLVGAEIALLGAVLGVAIGIWAGDLFRSALEDLLPLPVYRTPFEPGVFMRGALLGLLLPLAATVFPVWRAVRVQPIEAIRVGFRSAKGGGFAPRAKRLRVPGGSLTQMPLRNVLRTPRRTLMTLLGVAAVVTVVFGLLGMIDSFRETGDRSAEELGGGTPSRLAVGLDRFRALESPAIAGVGEVSAVRRVEPQLVLPSSVGPTTQGFDVSLQLLDAGSRVWRPRMEEGRLRRGAPGIALSEKAADDLGLELGDVLTVRHPRRIGPGTYSSTVSRVPIVGIHRIPFRGLAYMDRSQAPLMGLAGYANALAVVPEPGAQMAVEQELFHLPGVTSALPVTANTEVLRDRMDDFVGVLRIIDLFALILALMIAFNSTSISADERSRENATMFAFGVPVRGAVAVEVGESVITGLLGTLVGMGLGLAVVGWVVGETREQTFPELGAVVSISPSTLLVAGAIGVLAVAFAPLLTVRRLRRMDIPSTLRVVE
jgi:putative ABC transport system permease protein